MFFYERRLYRKCGALADGVLVVTTCGMNDVQVKPRGAGAWGDKCLQHVPGQSVSVR